MQTLEFTWDRYQQLVVTDKTHKVQQRCGLGVRGLRLREEGVIDTPWPIRAEYERAGLWPRNLWSKKGRYDPFGPTPFDLVIVPC